MRTVQEQILAGAAAIALLLTSAVASGAAADTPATESRIEAVRLSVHKAVSKASLIEEVTTEVREGTLAATGALAFPKKDKSGNHLKDASGDLLYETITKDGKVRVTTTPPALLVDVEFLASPSWSDRLTKRGIERAMMDGYHAAFTARTPVLRVTMTASMELLDRLGNNTQGIVYGTSARAADFTNMNWEKRHIADASRIWEVHRLHPAFR